MSGSVCTSPSSVIVRQKYSDSISRLSVSISVLDINCGETLRSVLGNSKVEDLSVHLRDLLFRQFGSGDPVLRIHRDRDELPERWGRFKPEFREAVELPEPQLIE